MSQIKRAIPIICVYFLYIIAFNILAFVLASKLDKNFWSGYFLSH